VCLHFPPQIIRGEGDYTPPAVLGAANHSHRASVKA